MSRTYKRNDPNSEHVFAKHALEANRRAYSDPAFAALVGFHTGLDEHGKEVVEPDVYAHVISVLNRGQ